MSKDNGTFKLKDPIINPEAKKINKPDSEEKKIERSLLPFLKILPPIR